MGVEDLTVEVTKLKRSWTTFLLGAVSGSGSGADWESISHYPEVVLHNSAGVRLVVKVADSDEQAQEFASVMDKDRTLLSPSEWCKRYEVPPSFADG
ncbi:MAG TPA: hypothetical protein VHX67_07495 [Acidimicrobiales bacterium]|nr:hypothetical protein [Acidimicrobiales bacterium]